MKNLAFVYFVPFVVNRNLRALDKSYFRDLLRALRASVVKNPHDRQYAAIFQLPKLSHNHSHSRGSTNIGAQNTFSPRASEFSTIHRHTTYANRSPDTQIPIIENPRERCAFWDTIAKVMSKTRPRSSVSPIEDPPWRKLTGARRINGDGRSFLLRLL